MSRLETFGMTLLSSKQIQKRSVPSFVHNAHVSDVKFSNILRFSTVQKHNI